MRLIESNATRRRSRGGTVLSVAAHAAVIAAAVAATAHADPAPADIVRPDRIYYAPPRPSGPAVPATRADASHRQASSPLPAPTEITTVEIDVGVPPTGQPLADVGTAPMPFGRGIESEASADGATATVDATALYEPSMVERAAVPLEPPRPRYPEMLRAANVSGNALVRFVVDTLGRVEPASIAIVSATHPGFSDAALAAVSRMRFRPAEVAGRRVRQLVQQPFDFQVR